MTTKNEGYITEIPLTVKVNTTTKPTKKQMKQLTELFSEAVQLMVNSVVSDWYKEQTEKTKQTKTTSKSKSKKH